MQIGDRVQPTKGYISFCNVLGYDISGIHGEITEMSMFQGEAFALVLWHDGHESTEPVYNLEVKTK